MTRECIGFRENTEVDREEATIGSELLAEAIRKSVWKFAWRHTITPEEARHLLLNTGVRVSA